MSESGITHLRVFPLWSDFQPLTALYAKTAYEYSFGEASLPDTEAGRAGVSEEACEKFEHFCDTAAKYNLKLIVALITGQMSFRWFVPPAFEGKNPLSDPTVMKWQLRFVKYFVNRFKEKKAIVGWDLGNEVNTMTIDENPDQFYVWCAGIANVVKACDSEHPVISGIDNSNVEKGNSNLKNIGEICDIHTTHPYNIFATASQPINTMVPILDLAFKCRLGEDIAGIPTFVQEFGSIGYMNCSSKTEADFYRASLYTSLAHNCYGTMWWCAFDQGHHRFAPYNWNNIGSDYGFFDKDRNPKPIASEHLHFYRMLDKLPGRKLPEYQRDGVIVIPRDDGDANLDTLRTAFVLGKRANLDLGFAYGLDKIPDAPLYILPSLSQNKSIPANRLDELLEKVENGAVLYVSVDTALIRQVPEIFGVEIGCRECCTTVKNVLMGEEKLPFVVNAEYMIESTTAKVIACDDKGMPVFFQKQRGKGYVYFFLVPMEKYLTQKRGAFFHKDEPAYDLIFRELARTAGIKRRIDCDSPFLRFTEHPIDDESAYICAINYSSEPVEARIEVNGGAFTTVVGAAPEAGVLRLGGNDGAIFRFVRVQMP